MTMEIWKFEVTLPGEDGVFHIEMPRFAHTLSVQVQSDVPVIWAIVNPSNARVRREFYLFGTGWKLPEHVRGLPLGSHLGTIQLKGGSLVFHVFDPERKWAPDGSAFSVWYGTTP